MTAGEPVTAVKVVSALQFIMLEAVIETPVSSQVISSFSDSVSLSESESVFAEELAGIMRLASSSTRQDAKIRPADKNAAVRSFKKFNLSMLLPRF